MKGTPQSLWLSAANRAAGWWMGHAANTLRRQQRAALAQMMKGAGAGPRPKRRRPKRKGART